MYIIYLFMCIYIYVQVHVHNVYHYMYIYIYIHISTINSLVILVISPTYDQFIENHWQQMTAGRHLDMADIHQAAWGSAPSGLEEFK